MAKDRRRHCDYPPCGKQYRYSRSTSKTCSDSCRTRLAKMRREAKRAARPRYAALAHLLKPLPQPPAGAVHGDQGDVLDELDEAVLPVPPSEGESVAEPEPKQKQKPPPHSRECRARNKGNPWGYNPTGGCEGCEARGWYPVEEVEITIRNVPRHFPGTPLNRGRRW